MKKLFVMTLAVAALASCSKVEPIEPGHKSAIGFGKSFVDNSTKAELTTSNILNFAVWGTEKGATIFDGVEVSGTYGGNWSYTGTPRYWHPDNDYKFAAVAPASQRANVTAPAGLPTAITYTLADGDIEAQVDLLYATANASTIAPSVAPEKVEFIFNHLLSKVQFTFTNAHDAGSNYYVKINNVTITAKNKSTLTISTGDWVVEGDAVDATLEFATFNGNAAFAPQATGVSDVQSLLIPNTEVTIAGTAEIYVGNVGTLVETRPFTATIPAATFESGYFYNITAEIDSDKPIVFSVKDIDGFTTATPDVAM